MESRSKLKQPWNRARQALGAAFLVTVLAAGMTGCAGVSAQKGDATDPTPTGADGLAVVPSSVNFTGVVVGQSNSQTVTLKNTGKNAIKITNLTLSGSGFTLKAPAVPLSLAPNASQSLTVGYTPTKSGTITAKLLITSSLSKTAESIPLSGSSQSPAPAVSFSPNSLNFGSVQVSSTSTKTVTLQNTGNVDIKISSAKVAGTGFGFSNLANGLTISPSQSVTFQVYFKPTVSGAASGSLSLSSANLTSSVALALNGTGLTSSSPPSAPSDPSASHTVKLAWDSSDGAVGYYVYRSTTSGGPYSKLNNSVTGGLSYSDSTVSSSTIYYYVVTGVNGSGDESGYSNEASANVPN